MAASHQSSLEPLPLTDVRELLRFYADAGVDEALLDEPVDRFAESQVAAASRAPAPETSAAGQTERPRRSEPAQAPRPAAPPTLSVPDEAQAARARDMAREAASLDELRAIVAGFDGCNLKFTAKQMVFADGNPQADLMLIGEAPGRDEDLEGLPFVGKSGRLLDRILSAIGIDRTGAYIANVIPWRPPGNRTPTPLETEICRPFIERQIELANPKVIMTLGGPAAKVVLHANEGVLRMRGNWKAHTTAAGLTIPAMPTLHPAYLLRNPAHKKLAWRISSTSGQSWKSFAVKH
jgi:uracil-DNA glycosylase family 4